MKTKSCLAYFGSDSEVAAELASMLDHCRHVTIPFVGGASILPHLKARAIVANDLHDFAICFYRAMSSRNGLREQLIDRCQHTLSHPTEIAIASEIFDGEWGDRATIGDKAWAMWALCWIGRKGKGGTKHQGGMPSVRRTANGGNNATRIRAAADDLTAWAKHFERCEWESVDFRKLLPKVADQEGCGLYVDSPWVGAGDAYLHSFTEEDHYDLEAELYRFEEATVVVRYGDHPLIRRLYASWHIIEASSRTQSNAVKGELWITNREPA